MFRNLKKRVGNLRESIHARQEAHHNARKQHNDEEKLNTPARPVNTIESASPSPNSNNKNANNSTGISLTGSFRSDASRSNMSPSPNPTPPTPSVRKRRGKNSSILDIPLEELNVTSKIEQLASFDLCVQAADQMAANNGLSDHRQSKKEDSVLDEKRVDPVTGLPCTEILVSPDGHMLILPSVEERQEIFSGNVNAKLLGKATEENENNEKITDQKSETNAETEATTKTDSIENLDASMSENAEDQGSTNFSALRAKGKDDYRSAVYVGYDLDPAGDKALNGFSAKGWSIPATSLALQQTEESLSAFAHFCEQMILSRKEGSARTTIACDNLRRVANNIHLSGKSADNTLQNAWVIIDPKAGDFEFTPERKGPLLGNNSTLAKAVTAVEEYYSSEAEKEADRYRAASLQRDQLLPQIYSAVDQLHDRCTKRQEALKESSRRAQVLEERILALQDVAEKKWQAVLDAEEQVTLKYQQMMQERRKEKEKARLEMMKQENARLEQETADAAENGEEQKPGATSEEIWSMVSDVVDPDTFEPMDLPPASLTTPRSKSVDSASLDDVSIASSKSGGLNPLDSPNNTASVPEIPMATREEIAMELGLHNLRSEAMHADEAVRETADNLLNVLSALDTTRRSARIAAESCLVAAANAQARSIQTWIQLEKESLRDRLAGLDALEEKINSSFNIRGDLDEYITKDKKERGGTTHLDDHDDGGIASALAVLSSHIDGLDREEEMEFQCQNQDNSEGGDDSGHGDEANDPSEIEAAIDRLFEDDDGKTTLENAVTLLCKIGSAEKSRALRVKRSKICYALNSKRSTHAKMKSMQQFEAISEVFSAILTGCASHLETGGVSNAKMCMMLAQTFYVEIDGDSSGDGDRKGRLYARSRLVDHPIWKQDAFWDIALTQQISESLTHSGVMANFEKSSGKTRNASNSSEFAKQRKTRWYDLNQTERIEAASQVHAVVFAQLGALAHSMIELGCSLERACAFVRRMSIRNQLPSSQRTMLLLHLMDHDDVGKKEAAQLDSSGKQEAPQPDDVAEKEAGIADDVAEIEAANTDDVAEGNDAHPYTLEESQSTIIEI